MIHLHKGVHTVKCKARNAASHYYEVNLEDGTGIEEWQEDFRKKACEMAINQPLLTGFEIWSKVRDEMVNDARLGSRVPDSKSVSINMNTLITMLCM